MVEDPQIKSDITDRILRGIPEYFGIEKSIIEYVENVKQCPFWGAFNEENRCVGFFAIKMHYGSTGDIYVWN
jgi:hypothetical protein